MTIEGAAKGARISRRSLDRLRKDPEFAAELERERCAIFERAAGAAASRVESALETLEALLGAESEQARLGAARALVEAACPLREIVTVADRVSRLEQLLVERAR